MTAALLVLACEHQAELGAALAALHMPTDASPVAAAAVVGAALEHVAFPEPLALIQSAPS